MFEDLIGQRIEGGCEDCNAYQVLEEDPEWDKMFYLRVYHDDTCPWFNSR